MPTVPLADQKAPVLPAAREDTTTTSQHDQHEEQAIGRLRQRLQIVYRERRATEVQSTVDRALRRFATARIRDYIRLLAERISRDELSNRFAAR